MANRRKGDVRSSQNSQTPPSGRPAIYLPEADPPKGSVPALAAAASLFALWFAFLLWMALST